MPYSLIRAKVEDYNKMKAGFDAVADARRASGSKGGIIFRNADDPSEVLVLLEYDNLENARQWFQSDALRQAMQRAGAQPIDMSFLNDVDRPSA